MSDQPKRGGGNPAWVKGGPSPNPHGRPRRGEALADLIRERVPREWLVGRVVELAKSEDERVALAALAWLRDAAYPRPEQRHEVVGVMASAPLDSARILAGLSEGALRELLQLAERQEDEIVEATGDDTEEERRG